MSQRLICLFLIITGFTSANAQKIYQEQYRPQIHFSPQTGWMNDPNGLIFYECRYHMFFQFYPDSTVWGPMHWGHAVSKDLVHWEQVEIALFPDSIGYIFSGSAVLDNNNTTGFGIQGKPPLVAVFTQHDMAGEKAATNRFQNQSLAYSLDGGNKWTKYQGNPVLRTPGLKDFRDPKISWYEEQKKWIMVLAAGNQVMFYSSKDLKNWKKESEFGAKNGAHGGVWECPDLIPYTVDGKKIWLLIVSINPGGAQGGSSAQYFTGQFDGTTFKNTDTITRWADYGADNYAGVTFSNTGNEKIFLGWMSNWQYGTSVPTLKWRSAMTLPRVLGLKKIGGTYYTIMKPVESLEKLVLKTKTYKKIPIVNNIPLTGPARFEFSVPDLHAFSFVFSNISGQSLRVGYSEEKNAFFIDRTHAGKSDFYQQFASIHYGTRIATTNESKITLILDNSSIELFADEGLTTMTEIFFPEQPFTIFRQEANIKPLEDIRISQLASIWPQ